MNFLHPFYIWIGFALCGCLVVLFLHSEKQRQVRRRRLLADKAWQHLVLNHSSIRQMVKYLLCLLATLLCALALARPRWGYTWKEYHTQGVDVLFAVDVSRSMLAEDLKPNRLERTKITIQDFVRELHGHRIGLIAFAYDSFIQCPMTLDYRAFLQSVEALDVDTIPQQGTSIASAVRAAEKVLEKTRNERLILLFSDGEELKKDAIAAAESAAKNGLHIFSIGVGTLEGGMIPIQGENRMTQYLKDAEGKEVVTKLDETTLKKLAEITEGRYVHLSVQELQQLMDELKNRFPIKEQEVYQEKVFTERFPYFLLVAIALWFLEALLSTYQRPRKWERRRGASWLLLCLAASLFEGGISESSAVQSPGEKFFAEGQYGEAQAYYEKEIAKHPNDPRLLYNLGTTYLAQKNLIEASKYLDKLIATPDPELKNRVFFDLGNICFEQGKKQREGAKADGSEEEDETLGLVQQLWENSISWYDSALALSKDYKAAEKNRRYVQHHLEELRRQREARPKPPSSPRGQENPSGDSGASPPDSGDPEPSQESKGQSHQEPEQGQRKGKGEGKGDPSSSGPSSSDSGRDPSDPQEGKGGEEKKASPENKDRAASSEKPSAQGEKPQEGEGKGKGEREQEKSSGEEAEESPAKRESSGQFPAGSRDQASDASVPQGKQQAASPPSPLKRKDSGAAEAKEGASEGGEEEGLEKQGKGSASSVAMGNTGEAPELMDGKMSLMEAKALLDSEAGDEKILPLFYGPPPSTENAQPW